jgi:hypothetical protein
MKPLAIELTKGEKRQLQSVGWKTPKENEYRRQFFATTQDNKPLVVTLKVAMPDFYDPLHRAKAVFSCDPLPEAVCVEISHCRLLPPPCFASRKDYRRQLPGRFMLEPWKWIYRRTHRQVLIAKPSDDGPLQEQLNRWREEMRVACEHESKAVRAEIERQMTRPLSELGYEKEEQRNKCVSELQTYLVNFLESETPIDGVICKGRLKWTLEDIKRGHEGIRDAWMHKDWANKNGWNLRVMRRERILHRRWLETHTGTLTNIIDATVRPSHLQHCIAPPNFGERYEQDPSFLEACASARFRSRFADNANTVVYLADCELREELTDDERTEFKRLQAISPPGHPLESVKFQHSPNYRQLFWTDNGKQEEAVLTKTQAAAFSALHNAIGFILAREEWQQEIYGDEPLRDFRPDKVFDYKDGRKVWDRFFHVEGDRYRLVFER